MPALKSSSKALFAAAAFAGAITSAQAQGTLEKIFPFLSNSPATTSSIPAPGSTAPAPGSTPPREWTGESGASGHPLMQADAIRAAAANFRTCLEGLWPQAQKRGISRAVYEAHALSQTPDLRIMDLLDQQPEFTKTFWDYLDLLVGEERIQQGRQMLAQHRATFDAMEQRYGVDRHVIASIWGIESKYGVAGGDRPVVRSTGTLACIGRRQDFFRDEFLAALDIIQRGDISPDKLKGSWAGAFGQTQFMPTTFKRFAIDFDSDGRRDIVTSVPDVIGSTAHNFQQSGWVQGQAWGYEVVLPQGFDYLMADRSRQLLISEWEKMGLRRANGQPFPRATDRAFLMVPAGARGPGFLMLPNFRVIMKYNPAEAYALAIGHLADRFRGGQPFVQAWPRDQRVLSLQERLEMQQHLSRKGFQIGEPDGRLGPKSRAAIRDFQARAGLIPDGFASSELLDHLRQR